ncbi:uncharacterized protein EV420DRAFT_777876 [Desarmillaria tabescens]|uniref:Uncharacterized protein n=1 Tax=Armillaria tabescens TaxID=1929756 RepID=A0AA39JVB0_ARMTA|nr:uncharacterized protein EV420DRAFT_777876 [Desarmillaria tabescens]KAK0449605.1 hypothetical protein EV420DRAFT_777876 [Desarmillaria tabescens]
MAPKHLLDDSPSPSYRAAKRRHLTDTPDTPRTPRTSYPFLPSSSRSSKCSQSRPLDSPSNPFGRKRTVALLNTLPSVTPLDQHVHLRFQFIRPGTRREAEGVYRIVRVPLSYTFQHLRCLISFLFGGDHEDTHKMVDMDQYEDEERGHFFEVRKRIVMYQPKYRQATIRTGEPWIRLSSAKDPYRYKADWDFDDDEDGESVCGSEVQEPQEDEEDAWRWEAEDELTLANLWPEGEHPDLDRGIIYYHTCSMRDERPTQVHITYDRSIVARRKGKGNSPHVLRARGDVFISPLAELGPFETREKFENPLMQMTPHLWNDPADAFARYLSKKAVLPSPDFDDDEDELEVEQNSFMSTPGLTASSSSSPMSSPIPLSSSLYTFPKHTPGPRPSQRKRIHYMSKRLERSGRGEAVKKLRRVAEREESPVDDMEKRRTIAFERGYASEEV